MEKALSSATQPLSPGAAVRRVLECMASGMLLTGQSLWASQADGGTNSGLCAEMLSTVWFAAAERKRP